MTDLSFSREAGPHVGLPEVSWLACRGWHDPGFDGPLGQPDLNRGVRGLMFGIGTEGAAWLARVAAADSFADRNPRPDDLAPSEIARGSWSGRLRRCLSLPKVYWAAVALPDGSTEADHAAVLRLVRALRARRDPGDRALCVAVTMDGNEPFQKALARQLLALGAFLVRPASGAGGDYLHHLPLRSFGHEPRLACVDLLDTLLLWESGREAWLHIIPADPDAAVAYFETAKLPKKRARGLDLRCHVDTFLDGVSIEQMSLLGDLCATRFLSPDRNGIVTSSRRLDGVVGTADLLLIV